MAEILIRQPVFQLWAENIFSGGRTLNISPFVSSVTYIDRTHGESDELSLEIDDFGGLFRSEWVPEKGQGISLALGYKDDALESRGRFEIDEIEFSGPPDILTLKALATNIKKPLRTEEHHAYEEVTLLDIAREIAQRQGLEVITDGAAGMADIKLQRVTQNGESDLAFLKRLAEPYGYVFKVTDKYLVFTHLKALESQQPTLHYHRRDLLSWRFVDGTTDTWQKAEVRYHDPATGRIVSGSAGDDTAVKTDTLKMTRRVESDAQARIMAEESLRRANSQGRTGAITVPGRPRLLSGVTVAIDGMLALSGHYLVETSTHRLARGTGYVTEAELKRV